MIASAVLIHVVIRLSDVPSRGKWSKCNLPLPVVLFVCSFNVSIFSVSWSRFLLFLSFFLRFPICNIGVETDIVLIEALGGITFVVWCFSIGWNIGRIGIVIGVVGFSLHALRCVGTEAVGDFLDMVGDSDGVDLLLRGDNTIHCRPGLGLGNLG